MQTELLVFAAAILASAFGGMLGMAGGIVIVPLLVTVVGIDFQTAVGASLVSVIACSCSSAAPLFTANLINIRLAAVLEVATTAGALTGVVLIGRIPLELLYLLFSLILVASAIQVYMGRKATVLTDETRNGWGSTLQLDGVYTERPSRASVAYRVERLPAGMSLMYKAGLVSALLGIGGGVLKIPAMDAALRLPIKVSSATSNFMIGATASASALLIRGDIDLRIAGPAALGSVLGALAGARILMRLSGNRARILFVIVLITLAAQMLLTAIDA